MMKSSVNLLLFVTLSGCQGFLPVPSLRVALRTTVGSPQHQSAPALSMVASSTNTPPSKYPVERGSEVDSRKIVASARQHLTAVRLNHILFASEALATQALYELRTAALAFDELASQISNCALTREERGSIGWVTVTSAASPSEGEEEAVDVNEHLDLLLPADARKKVLLMNTKPGDIVMVESDRGIHLVQIADVMVDIRKMSVMRPRNRKNQEGILKSSDGLRGILGGALLDDDDDDETTATRAKKRDLTYKLETMGCQMNQADSERMEGQLQSMGIRPLLPEEESTKYPDLVVLNTCSIRDRAEQKVYSHIGPHAKRKREGEDVTIIVAGCVAQQEGEALLRRAPEVDLVMGPQYANRLADLLEDVANGNQVVATDAAHIMEDSTKPRRSSSVAGWVNVIYGCNERCTYCIVPTTRGVEQSRPVESIVAEVVDLVSQGYKEVTLLGQNIDAFGRDMVPKRKFSDLIRTVGAVEGLKRLRFVTSHPRYMSLGVIDSVADTPTACKAFHVPFQSGSNEILTAMGRGHTREKYLTIVDRIRTRLPDASITADVIVGFPGETDEQFEETLTLMEEVVFDSVNTAAYSPRPNTPAAVWENQVADDVKKERLQRINVLNWKHAEERRARMMGRTVEVLVEERNVQKPTQVMGRTTQGYIVYCDGDIDELRGTLVDVKIDQCQRYYLAGIMV